MGPPTRGGWAGAARSTSTGGAQGLESRNVLVASTGTALIPSTTATAMQTTRNGKSDYHIKVLQEHKQYLMYWLISSHLQFCIDCNSSLQKQLGVKRFTVTPSPPAAVEPNRLNTNIHSAESAHLCIHISAVYFSQCSPKYPGLSVLLQFSVLHHH